MISGAGGRGEGGLGRRRQRGKRAAVRQRRQLRGRDRSFGQVRRQRFCENMFYLEYIKYSL